MNTSEIREKLLDLAVPKIILSGEVNGAMRLYVLDSLGYLYTKDCPGIEIVINSAGGDVKCGLDIYDALRLYPGRKKGVIVSKAESMAAVILQVCDERLCCAHAHILIHNGDDRIKYDTLFDDNALKQFKDQAKENILRLHKILANRAERQLSEVAEKCKLDTPMNATEALDFGLIDEIV